MTARAFAGRAAPPAPRAAAAALALSAGFVALCGLHALFGFYFFGQNSFALGNDDAFISFRYARVLVEHGVLSFNPGDAPPVEGFSNPLHVALAAGVIGLLGADAVYPAMAALGTAATLAAILLTARHLAARTDARTGWLGALVLALLPPAWIHATSGLETAFVLLAQVALWLAAARLAQADRPRGALAAACLAAVLLVGLRTDGFVLPVIVAGWLALMARPRAAATLLAATAAVFLALMAARLAYYGLPLPLTTYAKVSGDLLPRLEAAARFYGGIVLKGGLAIPLLAVAALSVMVARALPGGAERLRAALPLHVWIFGGVTAYYFAIGGDIYRDRFLLILFATGTVAALELAHRARPARVPAAVAAAAIAHQLGAGVLWDRRLDYIVERPKYDRAVTMGRHLAQAHPGALLATSTAGKLPYYSGLETIDMLGLNDRHIAMSPPRSATPGHAKWDVDYVFSRAPDVICSHVFGDGGMTWGLDRDRYRAAGYALAVLVRNRGADGPPIVEVSGHTRAEIAALVRAGYRYGCLAPAGGRR